MMFKYRLFLFYVIFILCSPICFAEDVYVGDDPDYTVYLRTESIHLELEIIKFKQFANATITYETIMMPKPEKLSKLRRLCLDDKITYCKQSLEVDTYLDRIDHTLPDTPIITLKKSTLYDANNHPLYDDTNVKSFACSLDSDNPKDKIYQETFHNVLSYIINHKEVWHCTYKTK